MEAAGALGRWSLGGSIDQIRERSPRPLAGLLDRRRPDRARGGAALRHARRPVLPPRRDRHRQPRPPRQLRARDGRRRLQRVGAAALLRARLGLDPGRRHRRVRAALALGAGRGSRRCRSPTCSALELRGRRAGILAAALVAVNPMLLWYSQEARGYSLLVLFSALAALYFVRALEGGGRGRPGALGRRLGARPGDPLLRDLPDRRSRASWLLRRPRSRGARPGSRSSSRPASRWRRSRSTRRRAGHAEWIGNHSLGHRLWEVGATFAVGETGDIIAQPERLDAGDRAAGGDRSPRSLLLAMRGERGERRAGRPDAGDRRLHGRRAARDRACSALGRLRPRPQPDPGAGPAARRGRDRRHPAAAPAAPGSPSPRCCSPTRWASASSPASRPRLQRPDWDAVGRSASASRGRRGRW